MRTLIRSILSFLLCLLTAVSLQAETLYVTRLGSTATLYQIDAAGTVATKSLSGATMAQPLGLVRNAAGFLFVSDSGTVKRIDPAGVVSTFASGFGNAYGIAIDGSGNLYVANQSGSTISKVTPGGTVSTFASGIPNPQGLAVDSVGNLFVCTTGGGQIVMVTPGGAVSNLVALPGNNQGMAFDSSGNLFVATGGSVAKITFSSPGVFSTINATFGTAAIGRGVVTVDTDVYVVSSGDSAVYKFNSAGTRTTFATGLTGAPYFATTLPEVNLLVERPAGTGVADGGAASFGNVVAGTTSDLVFTVRNSGVADLTGLAVTFDGADAGDFSVFANPAATVAVGGSTTFTIRYTATAGSKVAALHLASNAAGALASYDINLTASSLPDITVEQPTGTAIADGGTRGFGNVTQGSSTDLVFTIKNPGFADLTGLGITFDGPDAAEFTVFASPTSPVAAAGSTTFTIRHSPVTSGTKTAALHIANNVAGAKNPYDINLTASSLPDISVEQPAGAVVADGGTRDFGAVTEGTSADLVFTIKNPGFADLTGLGITFDGPDASEFSVFASPIAPVAPGGSTTFTVRFTPTSRGTKTGALHLANNVAGTKNPYDINLTALARSATPISGTFAVGPTGDYASITAAMADLTVKTQTGPVVFELQAAYLSTVETFPLRFGFYSQTTATNTLTIRPASGATALAISSADTTAATVDLNGAQFVTIDGRPGGVGTAKELTIENTSTAGVALRFINEASSNTLKLRHVQGREQQRRNAARSFSAPPRVRTATTTTRSTHCDIRDGATTPANGIYSRGSTGTTAQYNSGNTVSNCNVFNFYSHGDFGGRSAGWTGNTDWTISGNSFYQTASRAAVGAFMRGIYIEGNTANITGNNFHHHRQLHRRQRAELRRHGLDDDRHHSGVSLQRHSKWPSAPPRRAACRGIPSRTSSGRVPATPPRCPACGAGFMCRRAIVNIGTVTGNTIGSGTGTGSISVTTSGTGGTSFGIGSVEQRHGGHRQQHHRLHHGERHDPPASPRRSPASR